MPFRSTNCLSMPSFLAPSGAIVVSAFPMGYFPNISPVLVWMGKSKHLGAIIGKPTLPSSAFLQADLDVPVFMKVPQGWFVSPDGTLHHHDDPRFNDTKHFLKLKKNLYGCKQAARNWFRMWPSERRVCAIFHQFLSFPLFWLHNRGICLWLSVFLTDGVSHR